MCGHIPPCAGADSRGACSAHVKVAHPEQGWCLLCNGVVLFDDGGAILPGGEVLGPPARARAIAA